MVNPVTDPSTPYAPDLVDGLLGFGPVGRIVLADTEGFFGFAAGKAANVIFNVIAPARSGNLVRNLFLTLTITAGTNPPEIITYDASYVYERQLPVDTPVTIQTSGGPYVETTQTFQVAVNSLLVVNVPLQFTWAFANYVRRRYT
ncbi:hypothetical protein [Hymenobacter siberiensis]|uniref:hypothetical protein n=1 Tax=Hymenobacter siberiensis TaxID=2848396 RepID=UPI001C1E76A3|nr:hypothetical protein [Hymenobacter siberiensis]